MAAPLRPAVLLLLTAALAAAEGPPAATWAQLRPRLAAGDPAAAAELDALCQRYPRWNDGLRALAERRLRTAQPELALVPARRAWRQGDDAAAPLLAETLVRLGRAADALALARTPDLPDPDGGLAAWGAEAADDLGDAATAATLLGRARTTARGAVRAHLDLLAARLALRRRDWDAASEALAAASRSDADPGTWTTLARLHALRARLEPAAAAAHWAAAVTAAETARRLAPDDRDGDRELARCLAGQAAAGDAALWPRVAALLAADAAAPAAADDGELHLLLGRAAAAAGAWDQAADHLARAHALAAVGDDPGALALALVHAGRAEQARPLLPALAVRRDLDPAAVADLALAAGDDATAATLLDAAARAAGDGPAAAALWFRCGLARRTGDPDAAAAAFAAAGDAGHAAARAWYAHVEGSRDPARAYAAGRRLLAWDGDAAGPGWRLAMAGYPGGPGRSGLHRLLWLALALVPLWFGLRGLWRREPPAGGSRRPQRPPPAAAARPAAARGAASAETAEIRATARARAPVEPKAETEEVPLPQARSRPRGAAPARGTARGIRSPAPEAAQRGDARERQEPRP